MVCLANFLKDYAEMIFTIITLILTAIALFYVIRGFYMARGQLKQSNYIGLAQISNEDNWSLYEHYEDLPPSVKKRYTKQRYMWRVLHLTHLNLLEVAYEGKKRGALKAEELKQWKQKSKAWFKDLESKSVDNDINDGIETLKEIIKVGDAYSDEFRKWLKEEGIITENYFPKESI